MIIAAPPGIQNITAQYALQVVFSGIALIILIFRLEYLFVDFTAHRRPALQH